MLTREASTQQAGNARRIAAFAILLLAVVAPAIWYWNKWRQYDSYRNDAQPVIDAFDEIDVALQSAGINFITYQEKTTNVDLQLRKLTDKHPEAAMNGYNSLRLVLDMASLQNTALEHWKLKNSMTDASSTSDKYIVSLHETIIQKCWKKTSTMLSDTKVLLKEGQEWRTRPVQPLPDGGIDVETILELNKQLDDGWRKYQADATAAMDGMVQAVSRGDSSKAFDIEVDFAVKYDDTPFTQLESFKNIDAMRFFDESETADSLTKIGTVKQTLAAGVELDEAKRKLITSLAGGQ